VSTNPLVAPAQDSTRWYTGLGLVEDAADITHGIQNNSWVDGSLGGVGASLDMLSLAVDPLGTLASWGVGWLLEHVKPLKDALDWLAGNADEVASHAATWANVAAFTDRSRQEYADRLRTEVAGWFGASGDAYREHAGLQMQVLEGISKAAEGISSAVEGAGLLVALVRGIVRDLIADFVGTLAARLPQWLAAEGLTLGLATPVVIGQVAALVAKWVNRIQGFVRGLLSSLRRLSPMLDRLAGIFEQLSGRNRALEVMGRRADWTARDPGQHPQAPSRTPDSQLPSGDPVYHGPHSTAIGYDSKTIVNFDRVQPEPGFHDVVVHGETNGLVRPGVIGEDGGDYPANFTHPNQVADAIRSNPAYTGGPVRMVVCHSGTVDPAADASPAGQVVANSLGVPVKAPTDAIGINRYGPAQQVPRIRDGGTWVTFYPQIAD
jgi:hypothetical protein